MNTFALKITKEIKQKVDTFFSSDKKIDKKDLDVYSNFHLPISYLNDKTLAIDPNLTNDLELTPSTINQENKDGKSIYEFFLQPTHEFGTNVMEKWKTHFTCNDLFLNETKYIIQRFEPLSSATMPVPCKRILDIWKQVKQDEYFLIKYNYMDWQFLKHLNHSSSFLQGMSAIHLFSPIVSLILPILFFVFPFILLRIKNIPINFTDYLKLLKQMAKNHFFGVVINTYENFSLTNLIYLMASLGFFLFQVYQNVSTCQKFYNNIKSINNQIIDLNSYLTYSIENMQSFLKIAKHKTTYDKFCKNIQLHISHLQLLKQDLSIISPFCHSLNKFSCMGQLLQTYYKLYDNPDYSNALRYSIGFEGYINNLQGIYKNLQDKQIGLCKINKEKNKFIKQYYPIIENENVVKNNCDITKNMIISSPNKSGKTTFLKTTLINIILSQQTGMGFYESAELQPYTHLHCYLNIPDTSGRDSLFQAESRRCKDILDKIKNKNEKEKHFCIFDELYSGTNPDEATKAGIAFLKYLQQYQNVDFILTTHYFNVCKYFKKSQHTTNYKMDVSINPDGTFEYHYKIKKGISRIKGAARVLKDMDYPEEIIKTIENS